MRWYDRPLRVRAIPTPTEVERRRAAWWALGYVALLAFMASKMGGLW